MSAMQQMKLMESVGQGILQVAESEERKLDAKIQKIEQLDEDDFEALRQRRKQMLQKTLRQEQDWKQLGHGVYDSLFNNLLLLLSPRYSEVTDTKEFFNAAKKSSRLIVHFYRSVTPRCQIVDSHFERLAHSHLETRFVKIDAEKNPFLVERLGIILMPTIVLIKDGKTEHSIHGFDEFGGVDDFTTADMAYILATHNVLNYENDRSEEINGKASKAMGFNSIGLNVNSNNNNNKNILRGGYTYGEDDEDLFNDD